MWKPLLSLLLPNFNTELVYLRKHFVNVIQNASVIKIRIAVFRVSNIALEKKKSKYVMLSRTFARNSNKLILFTFLIHLRQADDLYV